MSVKGKQPAKDRLQHSHTGESNDARPDVHFLVENVEIIDETNKKLDWEVLESVLSMPMRWTITGASTVEIECEDGTRTLLNNPIFAKWLFKEVVASKSSGKTYKQRRITASQNQQRYGEESVNEWILPERPIDVNLDGVYFRLSSFRVVKNTLYLTFEDRCAAILREQVGHTITSRRGSMTRAQFVKKLCREAERNSRQHGKVRTFIPEERQKQPELSPEAEGTTTSKPGAEHSLSTGEGITIKGSPATSAQIDVLNEALAAAKKLKAPFKAKCALVAALIQENDCKVSSGESGDNGGGALQLEPFNLSKYGITNGDTEKECEIFLTTGYGSNGGAIELVKTHSHLTIGEIADLVQAPKVPGAYEPHKHEAEIIVKRFDSGQGSSSQNVVTHPGPYDFTRGPYETSWDCIQRLAAEVGWYAFVRDNQVWYVSGDFLLGQKSTLRVVENENGVDWVEPNIEVGARDRTAEVTVTGRSPLWTALPGMVVTLAQVGPANGKWVVNTVDQDVLDRSDAITVTLTKPLPPKPEPAASPTSESEGGEGESASPGERDASGTHALPCDRRYLTELGRTDDGVDIETIPDGAKVYSMTAGKCTAVASDPSGFGPNYPVIEITQGSRQGKFIYYGHVAKALVKVGDSVYAGQPIAIMGHTGDAASLGKGHIEIGFSDANGNPTNHHGQGANASTAAGEDMRAFIIWIASLFGIHLK